MIASFLALGGQAELIILKSAVAWSMPPPGTEVTTPLGQ